MNGAAGVELAGHDKRTRSSVRILNAQRDLFDLQVTSDVKFSVEGRTINVHKAVLKIRFVCAGVFDDHQVVFDVPQSCSSVFDLSCVRVELFDCQAVFVV